MRIRTMVGAVMGPVVLATLLATCVGPARSFGSYEGKAEATATDMQSALNTARLAVAAAAQGKAFAPYLSVALSDAEDDASSIQGAFDSIQPPDGPSEELRSDLDDLLSAAVSVISDLRIAARSDRLDQLPEIAGPLTHIADRLEAFASAHGCPGTRC